jgi:hypothetical protein
MRYQHRGNAARGPRGYFLAYPPVALHEDAAPNMRMLHTKIPAMGGLKTHV